MTASDLAVEVRQDSGCQLGTMELSDVEDGGKHVRALRVWMDTAMVPACDVSLDLP